ncbi:MAG: aspartate/glutamate racemase family protein [Pseudomonadota bacterium]
MRLLIINPNSTAAMTDSIARAARAVAGPGVTVVAMNPVDTPPAIQGPEDGAAALPGLFALFERATADQAYDAAVIACFDDTGVWDLKARAPLPVIGIGEAACHAAMLVAQRFSVVTTLPVSIPVIEENLARFGFLPRCARVRAADVPVLEFETDKPAAEAALIAETARAVAEDRCQAIVLGCAGMADLAASMTARFGLPVIDGVASAVRLAQAVQRAPVPAEGP